MVTSVEILIDAYRGHSSDADAGQLHCCTSSAENYIDNLIINQFSPFQVHLVFEKDIK